MLNFFKKLIPLRFKQKLIYFFRAEKVNLPSCPRIFVFLAADYGNIGDLAITAAQVIFLNASKKSCEVVRVPISKTLVQIRSIKSQIKRDDLITIVGGGNMGSLYPDIEELRQLVIWSFPKNRIVCFPQTLDWTETSESKRSLARIVDVYARHPNLFLFARESVTREKLETLFHRHKSVTIFYAPDIVLSTSALELGAKIQTASNRILLCLRDDRESALDRRQRGHLEFLLTSSGYFLEVTDTHVGGVELEEADCTNLVTEKINQFSSAKLVVTDRLHGMILSAIAGTPCLVLPNSNHKIYQTWKDWLIDVEQVRFVNSGDSDIEQALSELLSMPRRDSAIKVISPSHYETLKHVTGQL